MKSASMVRQSLPISLLIITLVMLPACAPLDWIKKQFGKEEVSTHQSKSTEPENKSAKKASMNENEVLISMDGKPVVTRANLEEDYRQVVEERPELKGLEPYVKANLLQGWVTQTIVDAYVKEHNIHNSDTYKKDLENMIGRLTRVLNVKYFREAFPVEVKEADIKEYYEKNKETFPDLILERGGVETMAVSFDKEDAAKAFVEKAKATPKDFEKLAQAANKNTFRDFKFVNAQTPEVDPAIKNAISDLKKFPHIQMVKAANNTYWVFDATSKKESKYRPFDEQVKEGLRQYMIQEKQMKIMEDEMSKLKEKYKIEVNASALNQDVQTQVDFEEAMGLADQTAQAAVDADNGAAQAAQVA